MGEQQSTVRLRRPTLGDTPGIWHLDVTCPACGSPMRPVRCGMDFADFRCSKAKWGPNDTRPDRCHPMQRLTIRWDDTPEGGDSG